MTILPLVARRAPSHKRRVSSLFDMELRALRRDRAARIGPELFLHQRVFDDCLERVALMERRFDRALLIGCPDASWRDRLSDCAGQVDVCDPGRLFAQAAEGQQLIEDRWDPSPATYDLVIAVGTLDTVNDLPRALIAIGWAMQTEALFIGAMSGGDTLPRLRSAMRAADRATGAAAPHVHPRIEPAALANLLLQAGFADPVVDVDRVPVAYRSFGNLVRDLRAMAATNILTARAASLSRRAATVAAEKFAASAVHGRTTETFEILHFGCWARAKQRPGPTPIPHH